MTPEPPEFHTNTLSPLSPLPVHPPEPSNIPVLRNQIDPIFNMTATHLAPQDEPAAAPDSADLVDSVDSASSSSSFSDAYKEPSTTQEHKDSTAAEENEASDDYAMTFDSDEGEQADIQNVSQENIIPQANDLPIVATDSEIPSSTISYDTSIDRLPTDLNAQATQTTFLSAQTTPPSDSLATNIPHDLPAQASDETTNHPAQTADDGTNVGIDIQQLLDNITANAEKNETSSTPTQPTSTSLPKPTPGLSAHSSLPPRPQIPQKRPYQEDVPMFHPIAAPGVTPTLNSFRPPGITTSLSAAGAPGTSTDPRGGLPPPPSATFRPPGTSGDLRGGLPPPPSAVFPNSFQSNAPPPISPVSFPQNNRSSGQDPNRSGDLRDEADDIDQRWGPEIQKLYDKFLEDERMYVTEGLWDRFPMGSRLFIGNLPSEKVTKRDLFHVFHKYGRLAQVSIKQAYGFIQFHDAAACHEALRREQSAEVRGRKMHLEISKPQKNSANAQRALAAAAPAQRSRSPDYPRGANDRGGRQGRNNSNVDRYDGRSAPSVPRVDEYGRPLRSRDDYRPRRSPSPQRGNVRGRDDFARGRDSYGRDRGRDRSRSPFGQRDNGRYRERSLSPRHREANADADLQIPRRDPRNIPDVQIILVQQLDRAFVSWVEGEMGSRGVKTEVMFLSSRLPLEAVIRRQILEGVHAVCQLDIMSQNSSKVSLQVFDRQGGADNVRFDEYRDLEPKIAAELVLRSKQTQPRAMAPQYNQPQFSTPSAYQQPAAAPAANPNLASLVGQLDNATLQKLLGSLNAPQQQNAPAANSNGGIDLAGLLGGLQQLPQQQQPPQQHQQQAYQPQLDPYSNHSALASLLANSAAQQPSQPQSQPQQSAQQVQNIMAQLSKYKQ